MNKEVLRLEDLPWAMTWMIKKMESLEKKISELKELKSEVSHGVEVWMNIEELRKYLPSHPAKQTVYGWVNQKKIPYYKGKNGKQLSFLKSEIDEWMKDGSHKSLDDLQREAVAFVTRKHNPNF